MAWHILHSLLDQVRTHSTFPGKLWIVVMLIFRIVVVARIGDNVYHDEQLRFFCNSLTPGCTNVCFNQFSPISQLRFWSLMILVVCTPSIFFFLYATHKIHHATVKFPSNDDSEVKPNQNSSETENSDSIPPPSYYNPPRLKRKRMSSYPFCKASAPPLYTVTQLSSDRDEKSNLMGSESRGNVRNRKKRFHKDTQSDTIIFGTQEISTTTDNNKTSNDEGKAFVWAPYSRQNGYPIYEGRSNRKVEFIKPVKPIDEEKAKKERKEVLKNPQLYRAYWWHVMVRTLLEVGFFYLQYFLYGFFVPELFECHRRPCPQVTECFVSRPMEKTCLLWLMYGLGGISCLLSFGEFWSLGRERFLYAFCCRGHKMTYEEKRMRLAELSKHHQPAPHLYQGHHATHQNMFKDEVILVHASKAFPSTLSLESFSSETTVESV